MKTLKVKLWLMIWYVKNLNGFTNISTRLIYAQAVLETGDFKSEIFKENKNLFGMREAKVRKTFATGTNRNHATYKNHFDSIRDYFKRQRHFGIPNEDDISFIDRTVTSGYAEDKAYRGKWLNLFHTTKPPMEKLPMFILAGFFFPVYDAFID